MRQCTHLSLLTSVRKPISHCLDRTVSNWIYSEHSVPVLISECARVFIFIHMYLIPGLHSCAWRIDTLCDRGSDIAEACTARLLVRALRVAARRAVPPHFWESADPAVAAVTQQRSLHAAEKPVAKPQQPPLHGQHSQSTHGAASLHPAPKAPVSLARPAIQNADLSTVLKRL